MNRGNTPKTGIVQRDESGRWLPGVSPNPSGRPKSLNELAKICQILTPEIITSLREVIRTGRGADKVAASRLLIEYGYGRPFQAVDVSVTQKHESMEALNARIEELIAKRSEDENPILDEERE